MMSHELSARRGKGYLRIEARQKGCSVPPCITEADNRKEKKDQK